ncbi:hypothetical protein R6Z07M_019532 [Ovis aries]
MFQGPLLCPLHPPAAGALLLPAAPEAPRSPRGRQCDTPPRPAQGLPAALQTPPPRAEAPAAPGAGVRANKEPDAGEPKLEHPGIRICSGDWPHPGYFPPSAVHAAGLHRRGAPSPHPAPVRGHRPRGGAGNTRRLRRSRGGRSAGRRCCFPISPSPCRGRGSRSRPSPGKRRGGGGGGGPALRPHDARGGAGRHRPHGARAGDDAAGRRAAAARVAGRQSAPRRRRRAEREEERQASSAARRAGGGPAAPARPWPGSPENASCAPRLPPPLPAPCARRPTELLASPPPPSCGHPAAGCSRTLCRGLPRAGGKGETRAKGPRRLAPAGAQRGM